MTYTCSFCNYTTITRQSYNRHLQSANHIEKSNTETNRKFVCETCKKSYLHRQSLYNHKKTCQIPTTEPPQTESNVSQQMMEMKQQFEKERDEMKAQIALLMEKHAHSAPQNQTNIGEQTNNNNNNNNDNSINIQINAFGNENIDYIDGRAIVSCIERVYSSVPALIEKIHFNPEHPENHNVKITNKKLPYASVMGSNRRWKTVDKKNVIETMVTNGYNLLDEKYEDNKNNIAPSKQKRFKEFKNRFEKDEKTLMKKLKTDTELLILNS